MSYSFYKLSETIKAKSFEPSSFAKVIESFKVEILEDEEYVEPRFSDYMGSLDNPSTKVVLISAAGATGKSALAKHLSARNKIPIIDLAKHLPVGGDSLSGLFLRAFDPNGAATFMTDLCKGEAAIIIDAIDEGRAKTKEEAFNSFLDNIVEYATKSEHITFIILGRTQALEHAYLHLEYNGVTSCLSKIEPFTEEQAKEFIDKKIKLPITNPEYKVYAEVRDYVVQSIEGFFRKVNEIEIATYFSFIGYAPVLQSISILLKDQQNFHKLLNDLKAKPDRGIDLIISIVEHILNREKEEKVRKVILPDILHGHDLAFKKEIEEKSFSTKEQCARLIAKTLNKKLNIEISTNQTFNAQYEQRIAGWLDEHPFLKNDNIQNPVFESYLLAILMTNTEFHALAIEYFRVKYKDAYLLFFIYDKIAVNRKIYAQFISYLYSSIKSIDDLQNHTSLTIESDDDDETKDEYTCYLEFTATKQSDNSPKIFEFEMPIGRNEAITFFDTINSILIDAPCNVIVTGSKITVTEPVDIFCANFGISTQEFILNKRPNSTTEKASVFIECGTFSVEYSSQVPIIADYLDKQSFQIACDAEVPYPFSAYQVNKGKQLKADTIIWQKFLILRRTLLMLRSHSKGDLTRFKDKIEHKRNLKNEMGHRVLHSLLNDKILSLKGHQYYLNPEAASTLLGVSWHELKQKVLTDKILTYLSSID